MINYENKGEINYPKRSPGEKITQFLKVDFEWLFQIYNILTGVNPL